VYLLSGETPREWSRLPLIKGHKALPRTLLSFKTPTVTVDSICLSFLSLSAPLIIMIKKGKPTDRQIESTVGCLERKISLYTNKQPNTPTDSAKPFFFSLYVLALSL
jgi:hypothetical protein